MTLYSINEQIANLETYGVDTETGELLSEEEWKKKYDDIQMEKSNKIEDIACLIKNLKADVLGLDTEIKNLQSRKTSKNNLISRLETLLTSEFTPTDKFETPKCKISFRKSDSLKITDFNSIPKEYIKEHIADESDVMKAEIKKAIKNGQQIHGAEITVNYNLQVK